MNDKKILTSYTPSIGTLESLPVGGKIIFRKNLSYWRDYKELIKLGVYGGYVSINNGDYITLIGYKFGKTFVIGI